MASERLYVLGHPVGHSKSPAMHNAAYRALGLHWEYGLMDCATEADAWSFLTARDWLACNVTMPWKRLAFEAAGTRRSPAAQLAIGANVLVNRGGLLYADNTDGKGCVSYLMRCGVAFDGANVAVCGTGPTSLAIMHACAEAGAAQIALCGRDAQRTRQALGSYRERVAAAAWPEGADAASDEAPSGSACPGHGPDESDSRGIEPCRGEVSFGAFSYCEPAGVAALASADIIVDATPLGMKPGDPAPFDTSVLSEGQTVFDVVYGHGETALLAAARAVGCAAFDGRGMLVAQAVETIFDIARVTGAFEIPEDVDLFAVMAGAAGFDFDAGDRAPRPRETRPRLAGE